MSEQNPLRAKRNIWSLATCQFLSSFNEDVIRMFVALFLLGKYQAKDACRISSLSYVVCWVPFFIFFGTAGAIADKFDRARVFVFAKHLSFIASTLATTSFYLNRPLLSLFSLSLFFCHVAILNPSKYSLISALVPSKHVTRVNSFLYILNMVASMLGQPLAAFLIQTTNKSFTICSLMCCFVALFEILISLKLPKAPPIQSNDKKFTFNPIKNYFNVLQTFKQAEKLKPIVLTYSFLYFASSIFRINIIPYGMLELGMRDTESVFLLIFSGLGFIIGAILSGTIKKQRTHLHIIQLVTMFIGPVFLFFYILRSKYTVIPLLGFFGLLIGMVFVSINSFIYLEADPKWIGKIIAATNFSSVLGSLLASGFILTFIDTPRDVFGFLSPFMVLFSFLFSKKLSQSIRH